MEYIAYYRVSKKTKGRQPYSIEAQKRDFLALTQGKKPLGEYEERESAWKKETGRLKDRPALQDAIAHARLSGARLVIAKLDRLARNVHFISGLMAAGVDFVACDNPYATPLLIHILAAVAEDESKRISARTRAGLAIAKSKGVKLGSARPDHWKGRKRGYEQATLASAVARRQATKQRYAFLIPKIKELREQEGRSFEQIAGILNRQGFLTGAKMPFNKMSVWRLYEHDRQSS